MAIEVAMQVEKLIAHIGKKTTISEEMEVVHSVQLSGEPLSKPLIVNYLRGKDTEMIVQTQTLGGKKRNWDLAAIVNADFKSGKLEGLKEYAERRVDSQQPVACLRQLLIRNAAGITPLNEQTGRSPEGAMVTHSKVRSD